MNPDGASREQLFRSLAKEAYEHRDQKQFAEAIKCFDQIVEVDPNEMRAYVERGFTYLLMQQYQAAVEDLDKAIALSPTDGEAHYHRGIALYNLGKFLKAIDDLTFCLEDISGNPMALFYRGISYAHIGQFQNAINDFELALKLNPHFDEALAARADALEAMKEQAATNQNVQSVFLEANDVGPEFRITEDLAQGPMMDNPPAFEQCGGQHAGLRVIQGPDNNSLQRIVDIRWVFPNYQSAQTFLDESVAVLAEYLPQVSGAPQVGHSSLMVGSEYENTFQHLCYLFVAGRVVAKIYGSQGPTAEQPLTAEMLFPVAERAAARCENY